VLRESARRDRVESRARERLGLPVDLAHEDGYVAVEERLSPLRTQLTELLRSEDARDATATTRRQRRVIRFELDNVWPDGSVVKWTYIVDARTYEPILLTTSTADGARATTRFERYETLAATEENKALLSLRAQHPDAAIDATEAGYQEAQARLYTQSTRTDG
jgi:hypothetical protein